MKDSMDVRLLAGDDLYPGEHLIRIARQRSRFPAMHIQGAVATMI
jgi:hypothetical protein